MSIASKLASAQERRDQDLNIALAEHIAQSGSASDVMELLAFAQTGARPQKHDAIKTLYEIGKRAPDLIAPHLDAFADLIAGKDNRMVWGGMTAIAVITPWNTKPVHAHLDQIIKAADRGSVIAKDQAISILVALMADADLETEIAPILLDRIRFAAVNQLPMYAELAKPALEGLYSAELKSVLTARLSETMPDSKRRRVEKVLKALAV